MHFIYKNIGKPTCMSNTWHQIFACVITSKGKMPLISLAIYTNGQIITYSFVDTASYTILISQLSLHEITDVLLSEELKDLKVNLVNAIGSIRVIEYNGKASFKKYADVLSSVYMKKRRSDVPRGLSNRKSFDSKSRLCQAQEESSKDDKKVKRKDVNSFCCKTTDNLISTRTKDVGSSEHAKSLDNDTLFAVNNKTKCNLNKDKDCRKDSLSSGFPSTRDMNEIKYASTKNAFSLTGQTLHQHSALLQSCNSIRHINQTEDSFLTNTAISLLLAYLSKELHVNMQVVEIKKLNIKDRMFIDRNSVIDLELLHAKNNSFSLYSKIKFTRTQMGARLLKQNILQPFNSFRTINKRQELANLLIGNPTYSISIEKLLKGICDLDQLIGLGKVEPTTLNGYKEFINLCIKMYDSMNILNKLKAVMEDKALSSNSHIKDMLTQIDNAKPILIHLEPFIEQHDEKKTQQQNIVNMVKVGVNEYLDLARSIFNENVNALSEMAEKIANSYSFGIATDYSAGLCFKAPNTELQSIIENSKYRCDIRCEASENHGWDRKMDCSDSGGYLELVKMPHSMVNDSLTVNDNVIVDNEITNRKDAPLKRTADRLLNNTTPDKSDRLFPDHQLKKDSTEFILLFKKKNFVFITTPSVQKANQRIRESYEQILEITGKLCYEMLSAVETSILRLISESVAELDVALSIFLYAKKHSCCFPTFGDSFTISDSYHPLVSNPSIYNNYYSCLLLNFHVVTGVNMSGKTTYMKQLAYMIIMGQIGYPVTAKVANLKAVNSLCTRFTSTSTYSDAVLIKQLLEISDCNSIILIDELGRSMSYIDGLAFTIATSTRLIHKNSYVYLTTHFPEILQYLKSIQTLMLYVLLHFMLKPVLMLCKVQLIYAAVTYRTVFVTMQKG